MPTLIVLYPAYGTVSCQEVARYAERIEDLKLVLADDEPAASDEAIFDEVVELPPPEHLAQAYNIMQRWCDKYHPDGIFMQSERGLLLGSLLASEFDLRGPSVAAAHLCSNKYQQRTVLSRAGIGNPCFALAENANDVQRLAQDFSFPLVLKCVISTMSRLVTLVCRPEEIDSAVARMSAGLSSSLDVARLVSFAQTGKVDLGCDPARQFLVESFLEGDFVETDGLVVADSPFTFGVTEQIQSVSPPFFIEGYLLPAECTDNGPVEAISDNIIRTIDLRDSGFSIEMRVRGNEVRLIEVNGLMQLSLGIHPELISDESRFAALAYRSCYYDGVVEDLPAREALAELERDDLKLGLATHVGARFFAPPHPEAYPHVAWALATHPVSSHEAYEIGRQAVDALEISIRPV
jgi:hypothetical protein